jgi:quinol monooxygenase YgiN
VKEPGCRQLSIAVSQKDANHVLLFETWDNAAAFDAFLATDRFKKYQTATAKYDRQAGHTGLLVGRDEYERDMIRATP